MAEPRFEVMAVQCSTCIFRPGNPMKLRAGSLRRMVQDCLDLNTHVVCHDSPSVAGTGERAIACRGFLDRYPHVSIAERMADAFGLRVLVDPATLEEVVL